MKLTDDMINLAKKDGKKCTIYNDDYVLLYKSMPVTDDKLDVYINKLNELYNNGINISNILDYKLVGPSSKFNIGEYTKGVFLERRAKGSCIGDIKNINFNNIENIEESINSYLNNINKYLDELEKRSNAHNFVFDKLIDDYLKICKIGLSPDPKPLNFFYDENEGYTIIDVIYTEQDYNILKDLSRIMYIIIFGYNFPRLSYRYNNLNIIPIECLDRFNNIVNRLDDKMINSLLNIGISKNNIMEAIISNREKYSNLIGVDNYKEMMVKEINKINEKDKLEASENLLNFTF